MNTLANVLHFLANKFTGLRGGRFAVVLDSERDRSGVVPAFCADAFGDKCAGQARVPAKGVEFAARCEAVRSV
jgi:hypothetical protein